MDDKVQIAELTTQAEPCWHTTQYVAYNPFTIKFVVVQNF